MIDFKLDKFLKSIYDIDMDKVCDMDIYYLDDTFQYIKVTDKEIQEVKKQFNLNNKEIIHYIKEAKLRQYEESYYDEYIKEYKSQLTAQIKKDFNNINQVELELNDRIIKINNNNMHIDFDKNIIVFNDDIDNMAMLVIAVINDYGMFEFNSIKDFYDSYDDLTAYDLFRKIKLVEDHLHWLSRFENIYGTIYDIFQFDTQYIDYYGTLGNFDVTINNIVDYIKLEV